MPRVKKKKAHFLFYIIDFLHSNKQTKTKQKTKQKYILGIQFKTTVNLNKTIKQKKITQKQLTFIFLANFLSSQLRNFFLSTNFMTFL